MRYNKHMTQITAQAIEQLALLSALELTTDEISSYKQDIERILSYVDQLDELDTDSVEPTYQVTGLRNVWRKDEAEAGHEVGRDALLALAGANVSSQQIKVPKVL